MVFTYVKGIACATLFVVVPTGLFFLLKFVFGTLSHYVQDWYALRSFRVFGGSQKTPDLSLLVLLWQGVSAKLR